MVFLNENLNFANKKFFIENFSENSVLFLVNKTDLNNFSRNQTGNNELEDDYYEENIDDNFIGVSTELSSLSSTTTTTSAYSSCSDSSVNQIKCVSSSSRESIETCSDRQFTFINDEDSYISNYFEQDLTNLCFNTSQQDLIQQICLYIDSEYHLKYKHISRLVSNCGDLKLNKNFWRFLLNKLNLATLLTLDGLSNDLKKDFFLNLSKLLLCLINLEKELFKCLFNNEQNSEEKREYNSYLFDAEFLLNLTFLLYEKIDRLVNLRSNLIFEIDLNQSNDYSLIVFEKQLNSSIGKLVSHLDKMIQNQNDNLIVYGSGRAILDYFKNLFENEFYENDNLNDLNQMNNLKSCTDCILCNKSIDVETYLTKPHIASEYREFLDTNPISQSYKCLANNLSKLNNYCYDPINENEEDSDMFGRMSDKSKSFSNFVASYYTMGLFEIKKCLFESPLQYLYEMRQFNDELNRVFKNDSILHEWKLKMIDSLKISNEDFFFMFELDKNKKNLLSKKLTQKNQKTLVKQSKWSIDLNENRNDQITNENYKSNDQNKKMSLFDEILSRIQSLNPSVLFDSYFKTIKECVYFDSNLTDNFKQVIEDKKPIIEQNYTSNSSNSSSSRSWTVAPKLFPTNTTGNCTNKRLNNHSMSCSNCVQSTDNAYEKSTELTKQTWSRTDPKPIGSKPASMFSISNSSNNRNRNSNSTKYISVNNNTQVSKTHIKANHTFEADSYKNVWKQDESETCNFPSTYISPFVTYENFNLNEYSNQKSTNVQTGLDLNKRTNLNNNNLTSVNGKTLQSNETRNKKYSVAPMSLINKRSNNNGFKNSLLNSSSKSPPNLFYSPNRNENFQKEDINISINYSKPPSNIIMDNLNFKQAKNYSSTVFSYDRTNRPPRNVYGYDRSYYNSNNGHTNAKLFSYHQRMNKL